MTSAKLLAGKRGVIMGVANDKSLAWGVAEFAARCGAELHFTYQGDMLAKRVVGLATQVGAENNVHVCDVNDDANIADVFQAIGGTIDFVVHGIGFSDKNELRTEYLETSRANFRNTMEISCYSLTAVARAAAPYMQPGGSILTLTYYGAKRVLPNYNVMGVAKAALEASVQYLAVDLGARGIRVNGLSSGPVKTLAASGIGDFRKILKWNAASAPLQRNVSQKDVGHAGVYLLSDLSSGVTGEIHYVDAGYNNVSMPAPQRADEIVATLK
ncbi:MAG: SDR family oxidoreductase [Alphaproteobacteria bacterium]|nr:SDR family oxidoreductase [Alphaproteobacteria bacterium]